MENTLHVDARCVCAIHYISLTLNIHRYLLSEWVCACACVCINNCVFVGWGGKASTNAELGNRCGRRQPWRWTSGTEVKRSKRKEGKQEREEDRGLSQHWLCGRWVKMLMPFKCNRRKPAANVGVFTCPKAQMFQRTPRSHSSPSPSPAWKTI